jgi:hypothetical protein
MLPGEGLLIRRACLLVWLLAPVVAGAQILPPDWSIPGLLTDPVEVPTEMKVNGLPLRLRVARSSWQADTLFRHFYRVFEDAGFYIPPERDQVRVAKSIQITGVETGRGITVTLILTPEKDGTTTVVMGQADFSRFQDPGEKDDEVPLMPGALYPLRTQTEGGWSTGYETSAQPDAILSHYDRELAKQGYKKAADGSYHKGDKWIRVTIHRGSDGLQSVLATHYGLVTQEGPKGQEDQRDQQGKK